MHHAVIWPNTLHSFTLRQNLGIQKGKKCKVSLIGQSLNRFAWPVQISSWCGWRHVSESWCCIRRISTRHGLSRFCNWGWSGVARWIGICEVISNRCWKNVIINVGHMRLRRCHPGCWQRFSLITKMISVLSPQLTTVHLHQVGEWALPLHHYPWFPQFLTEIFNHHNCANV